MLIFVFLGILLGIIAGLIPGIHSNTIISILSNFDQENLYLIIITIIPAQMIVSFIPSIFFGIPEQGTIISTLPGHRMTLEGKGIVALKTVVFSIMIATLISLAIFPFSLDFIKITYEIINPYMKYIVLFLSIILVIKTRNPMTSFFIFILAGLLGYISLNSQLEDPFLPLFSGVFAIPALILYKNQKIKEQKDMPVEKFHINSILVGVAGGILADLLPGISSPGQVAIFLTLFIPLNSLSYLATIASVSTSQTIFSLATATTIGKARNGGVAWLQTLIDIEQNLSLLLVLLLLSSAITMAIVYCFRNKAAMIANTDMTFFNKLLLIYLILIVLVIDGLSGIAIMVTAAILGYITVKLNIPRTMLMGGIIVPTLMLLFRIFI